MRQTGEQAARTGKEMEAGGEKAAEFFGKIKNEALGLIAVLVGAAGLEDFVKSTTNSLANLGREAHNIGVSATALGAFSNVIQQNGGSAESARQSLFGLAQQIENFKILGNGEIVRWLNPIGANINESPLAIFQKYVEFAQAHANDPRLINLIGHGLGFDQGTINAVEQMKTLAEYQKEYNSALRDAATPQQVRDATELQQAWYQLQQAAQGLARKILVDLDPALTSVMGWMTNEIHNQPQVVETIGGIGTALTALGAIRISAKLIGLTGIEEAAAGLLATLSRLSILALPLSLKGDIGPENPGGVTANWFGGSIPWWLGGNFWRGSQDNGAGWTWSDVIRKWWHDTMPDWLGGASPNGATGVPPSPVQQRANIAEIRSYFASQGYSPAQIAGILSNAEAESSFNPKAPNAGHYGLFQWDASRQADFERLFGIPMQQATLRQQLQFAQWELTHDYSTAGNLLRGSQNALMAGAVFSKDYEVAPGGWATAWARGEQAQEYIVPPSYSAPSISAPALAPTAPSTTDIHIDRIIIQTKATDAKGIAKDLNNAILAQANRGLN